jgi:hypothetical protein
MFIGTLPPVSNRAGFSHPIEVVDDDTDELVDLTGCTIVYEILDPTCDRTMLSATTSNGKVSITGTGAFQVDFTATEMRTLCPQTYQVGCTISNNDSEAQQFIIGTLPVLFGVVA